MLAACTPTYGQIERVLSYLYGYNIIIEQSSANLYGTLLYKEDTPKKYMYVADTPAVYWGFGGNYSEAPTVKIPTELRDDPVLYPQFIADLNILTPFFVNYILKTY
jgi:hypothetical protein